MRLDFNQPRGTRPSVDAVIKRLPEKLREDRDDVEAKHGNLKFQ
jgi:hypothetical protein